METRARKCIPVMVALLAMVLTVPEPAGSTTLLRLSLEKMSKDATMVVQGHVSWDYAARPDPQGPPYTYTGIEVSRCIAGDCPDTVVLRHRGGIAGGLHLFIPGMPRFEPGQEVLLFLREDYEEVDGLHAVLGMVQGLFLVVTEPVSGKKLAVQQLGNVTLAAPDEKGSIKPVGKVAPMVMELEAMIKEIQVFRSKKGGVQ